MQALFPGPRVGTRERFPGALLLPGFLLLVEPSRRRGDFCLRLGARGGREPDGGGQGARDLVTGAHLFPLEGPLTSSSREREAGTVPWESHRPAGEGLDPHTSSLDGFPSYSSGVRSSELKLHPFLH